MANVPQIIVATPPESLRGAARPDCVIAHMAYRIGHGFRLYRHHSLHGICGGMMVLDTGGFKGGGPLSALIADITDECARKDFAGIVLDAGLNPRSPAQLSISKALASAARPLGLKYFVPEALAHTGEDTIVRVSSALSGGTLRRHIADAFEKYGADRVALELQRVNMDFTLPAFRGVGKKLTDEELTELMSRHNAAAQFSAELVVNYFTYRDETDAHFVLYDNAQSFRRKIKAAARAGVQHALLFYPHVAGIYDEILRAESS